MPYSLVWVSIQFLLCSVILGIIGWYTVQILIMYQFEKVSQLGTGQKKLDINQCSEQGSNIKELRIS